MQTIIQTTTVRLSPELHRRLKIVAAVSGQKIKGIMTAAIERQVAELEAALTQKEAHEPTTR